MSNETRAKRLAVLDDAKRIASRAQAEGRSFTSEEAERFNGKIEEADRLARAIEAETLRSPYLAALAPKATDGRDLAAHWISSELRTLVPGTASGQSIDPSAFARFVVGSLAAQSTFLASGVNTITLGDGEGQSLIIPTITADATAAALAAAGTPTASDPTISQTTATPKKLMALTAVSNEVFADANAAALTALADSLVKSVSGLFDTYAYEGSGSSNQITGLQSISGINEVSMGTNGASLSNLDPFADAIGEIIADGGTPSCFVVGARTYKALIKLKSLTSGANTPLLTAGGNQPGVAQAAPLTLLGLPLFVNGHLSSTQTQGTALTAQSAFCYDASQIHAVFRKAAGASALVSVERDASRLFNLDASEIRATLRADVVAPHPEAICRIKGILA